MSSSYQNHPYNPFLPFPPQDSLPQPPFQDSSHHLLFGTRNRDEFTRRFFPSYYGPPSTTISSLVQPQPPHSQSQSQCRSQSHLNNPHHLPTQSSPPPFSQSFPRINSTQPHFPNLPSPAQTEELIRQAIIGNKCFEPKQKLVDRNDKFWSNNSLIGSFEPSPPSTQLITDMIRNRWKVADKDAGFVRVWENLFIFEFRSKHDLNRVLWHSPWFLSDSCSCLMLEKYNAMVSPLRTRVSSIPMWVTFWGVPPSCWDKQTIADLASSAVGPALETHRDILQLKDMWAVKVFVGVEIGKARAEFTVVKGRNSNHYVKITYGDRKDICVECGRLGHGLSRCPRLVTAGGETSNLAQNQNVGEQQQGGGGGDDHSDSSDDMEDDDSDDTTTHGSSDYDMVDDAYNNTTTTVIFVE